MTKTKRYMKREQRFMKAVSRQMTKAGLECKMQDNRLLIIKDGKPFEVKTWNAPGWGKRRVHFYMNFSFEDMEEVEPQGLMWLTLECNNQSDYTTIHLWEDHFSCCVETTLRSVKEFGREFDFAFFQINNTLKSLAQKYNDIKRQFMVQPARRPIGFLADRYLTNEEKHEECKLAAQTESNFADETK